MIKKDKTKKLALIGYGGHAREVMMQMETRLPCFVGDEFYVAGENFPLSKFDPNKYSVIVAIGDSKDRCSMVKKLPATTSFFTFIHPTSIMGNDVVIGEGSFVGAYTIVTSNVTIGAHAILSRGNHIGHDTQIGNYFSMMPGSIVSGNVNIENSVYIGTNSSIREKINICDDVIIGLNTGVISNIVEKGVYIGTPAKKK